jgi:hypothetical protein
MSSSTLPDGTDVEESLTPGSRGRRVPPLGRCDGGRDAQGERASEARL